MSENQGSENLGGLAIDLMKKVENDLLILDSIFESNANAGALASQVLKNLKEIEARLIAHNLESISRCSKE